VLPNAGRERLEKRNHNRDHRTVGEAYQRPPPGVGAEESDNGHGSVVMGNIGLGTEDDGPREESGTRRSEEEIGSKQNLLVRDVCREIARESDTVLRMVSLALGRQLGLTLVPPRLARLEVPRL
jgi:hypothetical protein